jgi:hypothetical protein
LVYVLKQLVSDSPSKEQFRSGKLVHIISVLQGEIYFSSTDDLKEHSEYLDSSRDSGEFEQLGKVCKLTSFSDVDIWKVPMKS